jgi:hypothetical protein
MEASLGFLSDALEGGGLGGRMSLMLWSQRRGNGPLSARLSWILQIAEITERNCRDSTWWKLVES